MSAATQQEFFVLSPETELARPAKGGRSAGEVRVGLSDGCVYEVRLTYTRVCEAPPELPPVLNKPELVARYLADAIATNPQVEQMFALLLNRKNRLIARHVVTTGTATSSLAHPREVFRAAILAGASAIVVAHNHPSGDPAPSAADVQITRTLRDAAKVVDIDLLDHVVVGNPVADPRGTGFYSFRQAGLI